MPTTEGPHEAAQASGGGERPSSTVRERVEMVIQKIRPYIQSDGGDISLVNIKEAEGVVEVALHGACGSCPSSMATLKGGVERMVRQEVPEIKEVVAI